MKHITRNILSAGALPVPGVIGTDLRGFRPKSVPACRSPWQIGAATSYPLPTLHLTFESKVIQVVLIPRTPYIARFHIHPLGSGAVGSRVYRLFTLLFLNGWFPFGRQLVPVAAIARYRIAEAIAVDAGEVIEDYRLLCSPPHPHLRLIQNVLMGAGQTQPGGQAL